MWRALQVGDRIVVHFQNAVTDLEEYPLNISPGGGLLVEGAADENCAEVAAGETCVYRWIVPDSSGPGTGAWSCAGPAWPGLCVCGLVFSPPRPLALHPPVPPILGPTSLGSGT